MTKFFRSKALFYCLIFISFLVISLFYIHPAQINFINFDERIFLSDGTDTLTSPYHFSYLKQLFLTEPMSLLHGAIPGKFLGIDETFALWIPMIERFITVIFGFVIPPEQISTAIVILSMTFNGFFMFLLSRLLRIPILGSWGLGLAWAINAYTRARAKVHVGLVGIYFLPLIFLSLLLLKKESRKYLILGSIGFLISSFSPFYYVITMSFISPFFLGFYFLNQPDLKLQSFKKLILALLPSLLWLIWSTLSPLPPKYTSSSSSPFHSSQNPSETKTNHPFLEIFGAKSIDYFSGDIGLGDQDMIPPREKMNQYITENHFFGSNPHERSLGVRWLFWGIFIASFFVIFFKRNFFSTQDRTYFWFFTIFGFFCFWSSLSPSSTSTYLNFSLLIHKLVPQYRVPNRIGIGVMFSLLMISGIFLKNILPIVKNKYIPQLVFVFLIFFELPPFLQNMPLATINSKASPLSELSSCGVGFSFPYYSETNSTLNYYRVLQQLRDTDCHLINAPKPSKLNDLLSTKFSWEVILQNKASDIKNQLKLFSSCSKINWILFTFPLLQSDGMELCKALNWNWHESGVCLNPIKYSTSNSLQLKEKITECLN
jgi:hypothetical protein